jgi:predicted choloylglycine hydrolase
MGLTQGTGLREKIRGTYQSLRDLEALRLEQPRWLPYQFFLKLAERKSEKSLVAALRQSNPAMLARMQGIAEGAGLPLRSVCLMNAMEAFIGSVKGRTVVPPIGACSALAVRRSRSRTGEPIIARNFDYPPLFQRFYVLRESRPHNGLRSLDFAVAPQAGTVDGVNEKGLAITIDYAFVTDSGPPNQVITMLIADALASCATVAEAVRRITATPRWGAGILLLADASGDLASVELSNTRAGVRRPAGGADLLLLTNVCLCPETRAVQVSESATYSEKAPLPLRGRSVLQPHKVRARRFEELLQAQNSIGPDELAAVMADHGLSGVPDGASPCVHTDYFNTTATLQWFPGRRSVRVSYSAACTAQYVEVAL